MFVTPIHPERFKPWVMRPRYLRPLSVIFSHPDRFKSWVMFLRCLRPLFVMFIHPERFKSLVMFPRYLRSSSVTDSAPCLSADYNRSMSVWMVYILIVFTVIICCNLIEVLESFLHLFNLVWYLSTFSIYSARIVFIIDSP